MINTGISVRTDRHGKELREQGPQLFNLMANTGDIHQFITDSIPPHWHRELELFILLEGSVQIGIGDITYTVNEGEGCFINTSILHSFAGNVPSPCIYRSFVFDPSIVGGTPGSVFDTLYVRPLLEDGVPFLRFRQNDDDERFFAPFDRAFTACIYEKPGYEFQVREALSEILLYTREKSRLMPTYKIPAVQELRVKQMLEWIDENIEKNITVKDLAATASICPRECQRIFSRYLHYRPMEYVQRRRILMAAEQLSSTDLPVTEIAFNCGFASPSYFSRQFRAIVGNTPIEYRKEVQKKIQGA